MRFLRGALRVREVAGFVTERRIERLQMQWVRIIDGAADFSFAQKFVEGVALFDSNGVLVVDMLESFGCERGHDAGNLHEEPVVFGGVRLAGAFPIWKIGPHFTEGGGL